MSAITNLFLQQVASIVQPICIKSKKQNHTVDQLYHLTVNMIVDAAIAMRNDDHSKWRKAREDMLIGEKASVMDALKELHAIAAKRREITFKYPLNDPAKSAAEKKLTKGDLEIIEEFINRLPEAYAHEHRHQENPATD